MRVYLQGSRAVSTPALCVSRSENINPLTHPSVIRCLSSVNCSTSSSSSIMHVSLVECCLGIRSVVTTYLPPRSFPSSSPHVARFCSVFTRAIARNLFRQSRGSLIVRSSCTCASLELPGTIRAAVEVLADEPLDRAESRTRWWWWLT